MMKTGYEAKKLSETLKDLGINGKVKIDLIPMAKNKVLLRVVNLADLYDGHHSHEH